MLAFIKKHKFLLSVILIFLAFFFKKAPFYLFFPLPAAEHDTLAYFQIVEHLNSGIFKSFGILPPGFILFCYFIGLLSSKLITILFIEDILYFFSFVFLLRTINKYISQVYLPVLFMMLIVILNFYTIRYETKLYPDFLYQISLIYTASFFIQALFSKRNFSVVLFSAFLIVPALIRSNGMYIYFMLIFFILYLLLHKEYKKALLYLLMPFVFLQFSWAVFNKITLDEFKPGYPSRNITAQPCPKSIKTQKTTNVTKIIFKINQTKFKSVLNFLNHFYREKINFYFEFLPGRYNSIYIYNPNNPNFNNRYRHYNLSSGSLSEMLTKELNSEKVKMLINNNLILLKHNERSKYSNRLISKWFTAIYFFHNLYSLFISNIFWLFWFLIVYFISFYKLIVSRFKDTYSFLVFSVGSIHLISILILSFLFSGFGYSTSRYIFVSEFAAYLTIALSFLIIDYKINLKKTEPNQ